MLRAAHPTHGAGQKQLLKFVLFGEIQNSGGAVGGGGGEAVGHPGKLWLLTSTLGLGVYPLGICPLGICPLGVCPWGLPGEATGPGSGSGQCRLYKALGCCWLWGTAGRW